MKLSSALLIPSFFAIAIAEDPAGRLSGAGIVSSQIKVAPHAGGVSTPSLRGGGMGGLATSFCSTREDCLSVVLASEEGNMSCDCESVDAVFDREGVPRFEYMTCNDTPCGCNDGQCSSGVVE